MINYTNIRNAVVRGLSNYLGVPVIRANQNATPPSYPYLSYTVTTLQSANNGTWGEYSDNTDRQAVKQTWSITAQSNSNDESVTLASSAVDYLTNTGRIYLNDNDVIVESVTGITNRDNVLEIEYEYKNGFDVVFWLHNTIEHGTETETIETIEFNKD